MRMDGGLTSWRVGVLGYHAGDVASFPLRMRT